MCVIQYLVLITLSVKRLSVNFYKFSHSATWWPHGRSTTRRENFRFTVIGYLLTHRVENMVIVNQTNTYTFSRIMHLPYFYMLNNEQLGFHGVAEAGVSHYTSHMAVYCSLTWKPDWMSVIQRSYICPVIIGMNKNGTQVKLQYYSKIILGRKTTKHTVSTVHAWWSLRMMIMGCIHYYTKKQECSSASMSEIETFT